jgi:rubrerythrin
MDDMNFGTIGGEKITSEMLETLLARCEHDWPESEVTVALTSYGKALAALQALDIPVEEIEALERRAKHEKKSLPFFIRSILQGELTG